MQKQPDTLGMIGQINSGARVPAVRLVRPNPKAAAMMSKLVTDQRAPIKTNVLQEQGTGINTAGLRSIAHDQMQNVNDNETIHQLLGETELAAQILTSVILSPKDMMGVEVGYHSELTHWQIPHEVNTSMTNAVRKYFEEVYKIKPRLSVMLDQALFKRGCYPLAVLPENAIDDLIHNNGSVTTESFNSILQANGEIKSLGLLGPTDEEKARMGQSTASQSYRSGIGLALEHLITHTPNKSWDKSISIKYENKDKRPEVFNTHITVTDNLHVLKIPALSEKLRQSKTREIVTGRSSRLSTEAIASRINNPVNPPTAHNTTTNMANNIFHHGKMQQSVVKEVKTQDKLKRRSVGMPLEIHFPSEAVIPVHVPNQPQTQIGFFVLLDLEGNPINRGQGINHYRELGMNLQQNGFASSMIQRAGLAMSDNSDLLTRGAGGLTMGRIYGQMLERDLVQRLKNGLVGGNISIAGNDEIYRLMLARSLSNQMTQILYIPAEYMTYIAFDYHTNGTGKSLLDNTRIIDSMQAMLLVGTVMGALRNSVGRTHVDLELDPDTPDPWKAVETMMGEIMRVNGNGFPLGTIDPLDIKDGLIRSQFEFGITGHSRLPNMKVDFNEKNTNYQPPDGKISEDLRKRRLQAFYLTPEQVDAAAGADFATSVANNSTLLSKRAMVLQAEFTPQVSAHLRKHAINSADLIDQLVEIIEGAYADIIKEFKDDEKIEMFDGTVVTKAQLQDDMLVKVQFIRELVEDFIGGFSMTLPEPDTTKSNVQAELYEKHSQLVEAALKDWISQDLMDKTIVGEETANHMQVVFYQFKSYFMRQWQVKNGMLPELSELTAVDEDGDVSVDIPDIAAGHNAAMLQAITKLLTANKKLKEKSSEELVKAGVAEAPYDPNAGSDPNADQDPNADPNADPSAGGEGGGDGGLGAGDFDFDLDGDGGAGETGGEGGEGSGESSGGASDLPAGDDFNFDMGSDTAGSPDAAPDEPAAEPSADTTDVATPDVSIDSAPTSSDTSADSSAEPAPDAAPEAEPEPEPEEPEPEAEPEENKDDNKDGNGDEPYHVKSNAEVQADLKDDNKDEEKDKDKAEGETDPDADPDADPDSKEGDADNKDGDTDSTDKKEEDANADNKDNADNADKDEQDKDKDKDADNKDDKS